MFDFEAALLHGFRVGFREVGQREVGQRLAAGGEVVREPFEDEREPEHARDAIDAVLVALRKEDFALVGQLRVQTVGHVRLGAQRRAAYRRADTTGSNNVAVGYYAGYYPTAGSNNIEIGNRGIAADNAVIRIGTQGTQSATYLAGVSGANVTGGATVVVNAQGQLGVVSSSRRYKEDIQSMGASSDRLLKLRPVTFRYKEPDEKGQKPEQFGLIAEEVAQVMPELVVYNGMGQPETVAYQTLAPLLLNELQREHKRADERVSELRQQLAAQGKELVSMKSQLAELRRLTAQLVADRGLDSDEAEPTTQVAIR